MADGPIYRSPADVAEAIAVRHARLGTGGEIISPYSIRARIAAGIQDRIDAMIRDSEGEYGLEQIRELRSKG